MKKSKNALLLLGTIFSAFTLCVHILTISQNLFELIQFAMMPVIRNTVLPWIIKLVLFAAVVILALVQLVRNRKNVKNRALPIAGIAVSFLCLVMALLSILGELPKFLIFVHLDLATFRYIINTLLVDLIRYGIIGHVLLLIGYSCSLPKKKVKA